jgi:hypothetical protein
LKQVVGDVAGLRAVRLRPAMQMDDDYLLLDGSGRVQAMLVQVPQGTTGSRRLLARRVDRKAIDDAFPRNRKTIAEIVDKLKQAP